MANIISYTLLAAWLMTITTTTVCAVTAPAVTTTTTTTLDSCSNPATHTDFIVKSCSTTKFPTLCYEKLSPYAIYVECDPRKLGNVSLTASILAAQDASSVVNKWIKSKTRIDLESKLLKDCSNLIDHGILRLNQSLKAFGNISSSSQLDYVKTRLGAAMTDYNTCVNKISAFYVDQNMSFQVTSAGLVAYRITEIALYFISKLKY